MHLHFESAAEDEAGQKDGEDGVRVDVCRLQVIAHGIRGPPLQSASHATNQHHQHRVWKLSEGEGGEKGALELIEIRRVDSRYATPI